MLGYSPSRHHPVSFVGHIALLFQSDGHVGTFGYHDTYMCVYTYVCGGFI